MFNRRCSAIHTNLVIPMLYLGFFTCFMSSAGNALAGEPDSDKAESYLLQYKFKDSDFLHYQIKAQSLMTTKRGELTQKAENTTKTSRHFRVVELTETGNAIVEIVIDKIKMEAGFDGKVTQTFDSADPTTHSKAFNHIEEIMGKTLGRMEVTPQGEIVKFVYLHNQLKKASGVNDENEFKVDPSLSFLLVLPTKPVQVGTTWTETIDHNIPVTPKLKKPHRFLRTYEVTQIKDGIVTIKYKTAAITVVRDPAIQVRTLQMTPEGTLTFDIEQGKLLTRTVKVDNFVINAIGPGSSMNVMAYKTEKFGTVIK